MATTKKTTTKATEVKEVKVEAPKAEAVKAEAPKAEAKKAPAKKATTTKKATTAKKETAKAETVITIQYQGNEVTVASVEEKVKAAFVAEGHKASTIKSLNIYVKPEEYAAYYVINGEYTGRVSLF
ncbi:MAG: DUF6465 family protein [Agathobacter sp.]